MQHRPMQVQISTKAENEENDGIILLFSLVSLQTFGKLCEGSIGQFKLFKENYGLLSCFWQQFQYIQ